ncbi:uncharacterized protein KZ484_018354 isoform 2-T3 [Pholidichthys leucotaenia]
MFDDFTSASETDLLPSVLSERSEEKGDQKDPEEGRLDLPNTKTLNDDLDIPFKAHWPVKTSSPIEENMGAKSVENQSNKKNRVLSPVLFHSEDEKKEKWMTESRVENNEFESPPSKITFTSGSSHKKQKEASCTQKNTALPIQAAKQEPEKNSKSVDKQQSAGVPRCVGKEMAAFLQKCKGLAHSSPCSRQSLLKVPTPPPEAEDDFLILEDDVPHWFSIPTKKATSHRQTQGRTSITDREILEDNVIKDGPLENPQKRLNSKRANVKLGSQGVPQIQKKQKEKNNDVSGPEDDEGELVPSKEKDKPDHQPEVGVTQEMKREKTSKKTARKTPKVSEKMTPKSSKASEENTTAWRDKPLNKPKKGLRGSDPVEEAPCVKDDTQEQRFEAHADIEDPFVPVDKGVRKSDAAVKAKQNNRPVISEEGSSEDNQVLGKRKRKQTGQWWLSNPQTTDNMADHQSTIKKPNPKRTKPSAAEPSNENAKKDKVLKSKNKEPELLSSQCTNNCKEKNTEQNEKETKQRGASGKRKVAIDVFNTPEPDHTEHREVPKDLDEEESSPLVLKKRDPSINSGGAVFQKVYHHSSEKSPIAQEPREPLTTAESERRRRRRRKAPGDWWKVGRDTENLSSQIQPVQPHGFKPQKERKLSKQSKSSRQSPPKNVNAVISPKPLGGAPKSPLKVTSIPKTVKCSLEAFKDGVLPVTQSPTGASHRGTRKNNRHNVTSHPAEISPTDSIKNGKTDANMNKEENLQDSRLKVHRSGPSSMVLLEQDEENGMKSLFSQLEGVLSVMDFCAPPLKPLVLQPKDRANLTEWFKTLWCSTGDDPCKITPDMFDWYFHQDRAMGFQVDINRGSFCSGKILLGSFMKKPLWVDHSATTVFNLFTSSVCVTIDGCELLISPGQTFVVQCGCAYSLRNTTAQPAVLFFTRILAESLH